MSNLLIDIYFSYRTCLSQVNHVILYTFSLGILCTCYLLNPILILLKLPF